MNGQGRSKTQRIVDHILREWQLYVMLLPTIIWLLVFLYKPMYGLQIALPLDWVRAF